MADTTPQTLRTQANCYICAGASQVEGMKLALLAQLLDLIQSVNVGNLQVLQDYAPGTPPPNPNLPALSYPTGGGTMMQWDVATQVWL